MVTRRRNRESKRKRLDPKKVIETANDLLSAHAPKVSPVTDPGRAALVIGLFDDDKDLDYTRFDERWEFIQDGSSTCDDDFLSFIIVATPLGAIEIRRSKGDPYPLEDVFNAIMELNITLARRRRVKLGEIGESVVIDEREYPPITNNEFAVVSALLAAGHAGLSEKDLRAKTLPSALRILRGLKEKPGWPDVIVFPGKPHGGYRIMS